MSGVHHVVFGLVVALLAAGAVAAGSLAAPDDPRGPEPRWVRRSVGLGAGALGTLGLWVATIVASAPSA